MTPARDYGEDQDIEASAAERPSKSARKRAAHAAQALGEALIELKPQVLESLGLPEELLEAVREAQRIRTSRGGIARQRQYIGKLMRQMDDLAPLEAALAARGKWGG